MPSIVSFRGDTGLSSIRWIKLSVPAHVPPLPIISSRPVCSVESMTHPPGAFFVGPLWRGGSADALRDFSSGRMDFVYSNKNRKVFISLLAAHKFHSPRGIDSLPKIRFSGEALQ